MNILLIVDDYLPNSIKIAAKMMHELAVELIDHEHTVTVITPGYNLDSIIEVTTLDRVRVCRFRSGKIKNTSKLQRVINETLLSYRAWNALSDYFKKNPHDLIVYYSPSIFWGPLINKLKKLWGVPSYLILRDLFPQWVIDNGILRANSPIVKYFRFFERINYEAADKIGVQCPQNMSWLLENNDSSHQQIEVLYNWTKIPSTIIKNNSYRKELHLNNKVVFFYGGNIGHAQDMMNIMRLVINFRDKLNAHFVFVGDGDEVSLIHKVIQKEGLTNVTLLSPVPQESFVKMLSEFDIGLFSLHQGHKIDNFPGKLLGYMTQEKPILGSVNEGNDLKFLIESENAGLVSINPDDESFFKNALRLFNNEEMRISTGKNGRSLLKKIFLVDSAVEQITKVIKN